MNLLLKKKFTFAFFCCLLFFGALAFGDNKVKASGIIYSDCYCIAKNKDVLFAPSSNADSSIWWQSSNSDIVSVSEYGVIHAKNTGEAEITATEPNGYVSRCKVVVIGEDPIRIAYPSNSIVGVNKDFEVTAITPQNVECVKFEVNTPWGRYDSYCSDKRWSGDVLVWTKNISVGCGGTTNVKTYAKIGNDWHTRVEGDFSVKAVDSYDKNSSSLQERSVSKGGAEFIASCEGFINHVYKDPANILTIGYGKKVNPYEQFYNNITSDEGVAVFSKLLSQGYYARSVNNFLIGNGIKFNQNQFDALVSFCYNLGCGWLNNGSYLSSILKNCAGASGGGYYTGKVNSDNGLNVRSGPGTNHRRLCALPNRTVVTVLDDARKDNNWYKIRTGGGTEGYCCGDYLEVTYLGGSERSLNNINRNEFINEFCLYHHAAKKCLKGLVIRRFQELDMFFYGVYNKFRCGNYNCGGYPVPDCARNIM